MANTKSFIVCGSGNFFQDIMQLFTLFRTVISFITKRNISRLEEKRGQLEVVETIKVLCNKENEQEDNPFAIEGGKLRGDLQEELTSTQRIYQSLDKIENILMKSKLYLQGMDGMCEEETNDDQNLNTLEENIVNCVPNYYTAKCLQFGSTVKKNYLDHRSIIVQDLLTANQRNLKTIPIEKRRAHLAGHRDRLRRGRGSAVQRSVLEIQKCGYLSERPSGKQDQPIWPNESKEVSVFKDVTMGKQKLEEPEGIKDDHPEVRPVKDSCSKEEEKSKLEVALEMLYDIIDIEIKNRAKKLEEMFRDMLDAKMDLTNFNKCNEETENILRALEAERESRKEQKAKMSGEINRLKEEKETQMKEKENILRALEAERESRKEQKAKMSDEINRLKEEREYRKEQKDKMIGEINRLKEEREYRKEQKAKMIDEINRLIEEKEIQMKEKENILRALEAERENRKEQKAKMSDEINRLKEEREYRKEQKAKMIDEINRLKEEREYRKDQKGKIIGEINRLKEEREYRKEQKAKMSDEINRLKEEREYRKEQKAKMIDEINR
ncbi:plasminogen-binding group A streptococcal M-like protein PAM [Palaemon carinicauda]|uniref:plasminogen-binding group A streptococcal M-like protein PAM n=1 Tax=Palaemon carinicauda TaxID=392227 RepID=UPI0035B5D453